METQERPSIKNIAVALSKFQSELEAAKKDSENPFLKSFYSDLRSVWNVIREPLAKNGLAVTQIPTIHEKLGMILVTKLLHTSGEFIESSYPINPVKNDPQGVGSALTYARRYALSAILGVVSEGDDDGHRATNGKPIQEPKRKQEKKPPPTGVSVISESQRKRFFAKWRDGGKTEAQVKAKLREVVGTEHSRDIPKDKYAALCEWADKKESPEDDPEFPG